MEGREATMNTTAVGLGCLPRGSGLRFASAAWATVSLSAFAHAQNAPQPAFQYQSGDIRVSIPSADEPRVETFGPQSLAAAANYLEAGALSWVRGERTCVNCHTTGPYMAERTAWSKQLGQPSEEVHANFVDAVPSEDKEVRQTDKSGHKYYPGATASVWRSVGLAEWDRHIAGKLSEATQRSLRDMFERQSDDGSFVSHGEVE